MTDQNRPGMAGWDWDAGRRRIADTTAWKKTHGYVEEACMRPDGEAAAAVVRTDDAEFSVVENEALWEGRWDKIWKLGYGADGRLSGLVSELGAWTVATQGVAWDESFDFIWELKRSDCGRHLAVLAQRNREYLAVLDGTPWEKGFLSATGLAVSPDGSKTAAPVQTVALQQAEIEKFQSGCFSAATDGLPWTQNFVNVWDLVFSDDASRLAGGVRTSLYDYTVAVDGKAWEQSFSGVWKPVFLKDGRVAASVRHQGKWQLMADGTPLWEKKFVQLWQLVQSETGRIAAICAPEFGRWTLALDDHPWKTRFNRMVSAPTFSPDGTHLACLGKNDNGWTVCVDDRSWEMGFDMVWNPVFSPDGHHVAVRAEKNGRQAIFLDGHSITEPMARTWDPVFSPEGDRVLLRGIPAEGADAGKVIREVRILK